MPVDPAASIIVKISANLGEIIIISMLVEFCARLWALQCYLWNPLSILPGCSHKPGKINWYESSDATLIQATTCAVPYQIDM